ncbi:hypothetical protein PQR63_23220 [Herbaspirillum rhizosphaerae]|uniref:Uncharacterized protein n=1 Tax=Herbaspirillum rhizosphaerae TaxID=346179 RepID=A0ABW8ZEK5_9BURK
MHIIHQHQTSVTLFERNGNFVVFRSMKEVLKKLGYPWINSNVGPHFRIFTGIAYKDYQYILRNDLGETVTAESFIALHVKSVQKYRTHRFEHGPVPGTGNGKPSRYFRNIRYINARRAAQYFANDGEITPRAARTINLLPDAWDDLKISSRRFRSWKQFRKTQWR